MSFAVLSLEAVMKYVRSEAPLQIRDERVLLVRKSVVQFRAVLGVVLCYASVLMAGDDESGEVGEAGDGDFGDIVHHDAHAVLFRLLTLRVLVDIVDHNRAELSLSLFRHTQQLPAVLGELHALDGSTKLPTS